MLRLTLLATVRLAQAATPINDWVWGAQSFSCAATCTDLGRACDDDRIYAIRGADSSNFRAARAGAGWSSAWCAESDPNSGGTGASAGVSYRDAAGGCIYPGTLSPQTKPPGICGWTFSSGSQWMYVFTRHRTRDHLRRCGNQHRVSHVYSPTYPPPYHRHTRTLPFRRLCCCLALGHDPSTSCPVMASDCDAGYAWDATPLQSQSCIPCDAGGYCSSDGLREICPSGRYNSATESTTAQACLPCPVGKFGEAEEKTSELLACTGSCAAGTFGKPHKILPTSPVETRNEAISCIACTVGLYNNEIGQTACKNCGKGTYNDQEQRTSSSDCQQCGSGKYSSEVARNSSTDCRNCMAGSWSTTQGATIITQCIGCAPGKYSSTPGGATEGPFHAYAKFICIHDSHVFTNTPLLPPLPEFRLTESCLNCTAGKYVFASTTAGQATSDAVCKDCVLGKWSSTVAAVSVTSCVDCVAGKFSGNPGGEGYVSEILGCRYDCPTGKFANASAIGETTEIAACTPCQVGRYNDFTGTDAVGEEKCRMCPEGSWSNQTGTKAASDCKSCSKGRHGNGQKGLVQATDCTLCEPGRFSSAKRLAIGPCEGACPPGTFSDSWGAVDSGTCVDCALDVFNRSKVAAQGSSECKACVGFTSPTGDLGSCAELELQKCNAGYHAASAVSTVCEQCTPGR